MPAARGPRRRGAWAALVLLGAPTGALAQAPPPPAGDAALPAAAEALDAPPAPAEPPLPPVPPPPPGPAAAPWAPRPATAAAPAPAAPRPAADPGWAAGAGWGGLGAAALVAAMGIAGEDAGTTDAKMGYAGVIMATVAIGGPIIAFGGASARNRRDIRGVLGLRIAGWVTCAVTIANGASVLYLGRQGVDLSDGPLLMVGVLGTISLALSSADALLSAGQAERAREREAPPAAAVAPHLRLVGDADGRPRGAVLGLGGTF